MNKYFKIGGIEMYSLKDIQAMELEAYNSTMPEKIEQIRFEDWHNAKGVFQSYTYQGRLVCRTKLHLEEGIPVLFIDDLVMNDSFKVTNPSEVLKCIEKQQIKA
jgi:hypothetical protein